jgi:hypothetical protein
MGFLDWIGRTRNGISGEKPRATWISDVYADQGTWAWAWAQETQSGRFDAGVTVRDQYFGVWKLSAGEGYDKEADAIRQAQARFKEFRVLEPEMKIASARVHNVVKHWHVMAETPLGRELANEIAGGQLHDPVRVPKTEADLKRDALFEMALVVHHIANDPDPDWRKYRAHFEEAVSGLREALGPEIRHQGAEKIGTNATPLDAEMQRGEANRQQPEKSRSRER